MKVLRWIWALVPVLSIGTLSWLSFGFLAARRRSVLLSLAAFAYLGVLAVMLVAGRGVGAVSMLLLWGTSSFHAFWIAGGRGGACRTAVAAPVVAAPVVASPLAAGAPAGWAPPPPLPGQPGPPDALLAEIRSSATRFTWAPADRRVDQAVWAGLHTIVVDSWTLLTTARQKGITGDQLIAVEMMYGDYVPSSVRAVTALVPEQLVTVEDAARANASAREIVDAISRELTAMMRSVSSGDLSKLDEQRAFLQSRFGSSGSIRL